MSHNVSKHSASKHIKLNPNQCAVMNGVSSELLSEVSLLQVSIKGISIDIRVGLATPIRELGIHYVKSIPKYGYD